jgi:hypothetical protein
MTSTADTIDHNTLAHLAQAGAIHGADVFGQPGGWGVTIQYGVTERTLAARRGAIRVFKRFETLVAYLKELGIAEYRVNATNYDPIAIKTGQTRPDAAARLKRAHEAASYDGWFTSKVESALQGIKDGNNDLISDEEWLSEQASQGRAS